MNLNINTWKEFKIKDLFIIKYGVNLELINCEEIDKNEKNAIPFVSRTGENNGVSAYVKKLNHKKVQKAGLLSIAGGGTVLSTFLQNKPFYSGRDLYTLESKENLSNEVKLFLSTIIEKNKYKYNYGRQANKTLPEIIIKLPIIYENNNPKIDNNKTYSENGYIPDFQFMEDYIKSLHYKPITTTNKRVEQPINTTKWKWFQLKELFNISAGKYHSKDEFDTGDTPYISASNNHNGIKEFIDLNPQFYGNCITTGKVGCTAFYQENDFCATSDVNILRPKNNDFNKFHGIFIVSIINFSENYKWNYGRQCRIGDSEEIEIKLPVTEEGKPDWEYMENYIKSLPYADRI